jgi:hypothetical protein
MVVVAIVIILELRGQFESTNGVPCNITIIKRFGMEIIFMIYSAFGIIIFPNYLHA